VGETVAVLVAVAVAGGLVALVIAGRRRQRRLVGRLSGLVDELSSAGPAGAIAGGSGAIAGRAPVGSGVDDVLDQLERAVARDMATRRDTATVFMRLAQALAVVSQGVVVCDETGVVRYRNDAGAVFAQARHGDALAERAVSELLATALAGGPVEQQLELYGPPRRTLQITARPLGEAETIGAVAIIEDISERRRIDAVRRDFVANVSHELKTPVGALGILSETMQAEDDPSVTRRLAERMNLEAFRVARIIEDLLDLSRIESEESPRREPVPVHLIVAEAVERIRPLAEHRRIAIDAGEAPSRLAIVGDRRQLVSAVHNLLENAVKYSDEGSSVQVRCRVVGTRSPATASSNGTAVELSVRDHGMGIPSRDLERIFERFYRVDRARSRETGGTGLGLSIVRHVATNHGGEVDVVSREGEGSTFTLRLPAGPGPVVMSSAEAG
jgi:two-component system sensor histidine kinase SenX3